MELIVSNDPRTIFLCQKSIFIGASLFKFHPN